MSSMGKLSSSGLMMLLCVGRCFCTGVVTLVPECIRSEMEECGQIDRTDSLSLLQVRKSVLKDNSAVLQEDHHHAKKRATSPRRSTIRQQKLNFASNPVAVLVAQKNRSNNTAGGTNTSNDHDTGDDHDHDHTDNKEGDNPGGNQTSHEENNDQGQDHDHDDNDGHGNHTRNDHGNNDHDHDHDHGNDVDPGHKDDNKKEDEKKLKVVQVIAKLLLNIEKATGSKKVKLQAKLGKIYGHVKLHINKTSVKIARLQKIKDKLTEAPAKVEAAIKKLEARNASLHGSSTKIQVKIDKLDDLFRTLVALLPADGKHASKAGDNDNDNTAGDNDSPNNGGNDDDSNDEGKEGRNTADDDTDEDEDSPDESSTPNTGGEVDPGTDDISDE